jgi:hypothetical protein
MGHLGLLGRLGRLLLLGRLGALAVRRSLLLLIQMNTVAVAAPLAK